MNNAGILDFNKLLDYPVDDWDPVIAVSQTGVFLGWSTPPMTADLDTGRTIRSVPICRAAEPGEVASVVVFLPSDEASYCTGQEFTVDGGVHS